MRYIIGYIKNILFCILLFTLFASKSYAFNNRGSDDILIRSSFFPTVFLEPAPIRDTVVFIKFSGVINGISPFSLEQGINLNLRRKGYRVTNNPNEANIILQASISGDAIALNNTYRKKQNNNNNGAIVAGALIGGILGAIAESEDDDRERRRRKRRRERRERERDLYRDYDDYDYKYRSDRRRNRRRDHDRDDDDDIDAIIGGAILGGALGSLASDDDDRGYRNHKSSITSIVSIQIQQRANINQAFNSPNIATLTIDSRLRIRKNNRQSQFNYFSQKISTEIIDSVSNLF